MPSRAGGASPPPRKDFDSVSLRWVPHPCGVCFCKGGSFIFLSLLSPVLVSTFNYALGPSAVGPFGILSSLGFLHFEFRILHFDHRKLPFNPQIRPFPAIHFTSSPIPCYPPSCFARKSTHRAPSKNSRPRVSPLTTHPSPLLL